MVKLTDDPKNPFGLGQDQGPLVPLKGPSAAELMARGITPHPGDDGPLSQDCRHPSCEQNYRALWGKLAALRAECDSLAAQLAVVCGLADKRAAELRKLFEGDPCARCLMEQMEVLENLAEELRSTLPETGKAMIEVVEKVEKLKARWDYIDRSDCAADLFVALSNLRGSR